ncbi:MAG: GntR family transcriptional regulator [Syntrophales bacterium]
MTNTTNPDSGSRGKGIDFQDIVPLYFQLKEIIKENIRHSQWKVGELIPSEHRLAEMYGVSVGTVKKALGELSNEGVVYRQKGKGTYVTRPDFLKSFNRFFLHGLRGKDDTARLRSRILESLVVKPDAEVRNKLRLTDKDRANRIKRVRLINDTPYIVETIYLPNGLFKGIEKVDLSEGLLYPVYETRFNVPIVWAEEFLEPRGADKEVARLLDYHEGKPTISIERIAYTFDDVPVELRFSIGRGDRFRYRIEIR